MVGNALASAERLHPATDCTPVTGVTGTAYRTDGLTAGQYACYSPIEYGWCSAHSDLHAHRKVPPPPPSKSPPPPQALATTSVKTCDDSLATGAIAGIAVGCAVAGILIGLALGFVIAKKKQTSAAWPGLRRGFLDLVADFLAVLGGGPQDRESAPTAAVFESR
eukprot:scaffold27649_cov69-Phaeocystis_antarctica.AAC.1